MTHIDSRAAANTPSRTVAVQPLDGHGAGGALVGGKAAALDRLIGWGFPVPSAVAVTADAYRAVVAQPEIAAVLERLSGGAEVTAVEIDTAFQHGGLPDDIAAQVYAAVAAIGAGRPVAIRSSATVEDLDGSSFAGQYESVLGVDPDDRAAVARAVLTVFSSLHHPAPRAYRRALGIAESDAAMAALVMVMVPAERSGVLFTQDPTGPPGTVRIETVTGLADVLVSGKQTPGVLRVSDGAVAPDTAPEIAPLLSAAREIERRAGRPQDMEWAWDGHQLWIVQARPITVGADSGDPFDTPPPELADRDLTTAGIAEMLPGVLPPLRWDVCSFVVEEALRAMLDALGSLPVEELDQPHRLLRRVHGRAALDAGLTRTAPDAGPARRGQAPEAVAKRHPERGFAAARHRLLARTARRHARFDAEVVIRAAIEIDSTAPVLASSTADELLRYQLAMLDLSARAMAAEIIVAADAGAIHEGLCAVLARYTDAAAARRLADVLTVPVTAATPTARASMAIPTGPTWLEQHRTPPARTVPVAGGDPLDEVVTAIEASARWPKSAVLRWMRQRQVERLGAEAAEQLHRRERTKQAILLLGGELRRVHLEIGRRLVLAGALPAAGDVELLTVAELRTALRGARPPAPLTLERRRRHIRRHRDHEPLPQHFHGRPEHPPAISGHRLTGWAAGSGRFRGIARYLTQPEQQIGHDEVLVAVTTDPSWAPLLMRCGAMVIEQGGPLSHAAILAREFGVPAVFNLPGAAGALAGHRVEVDGDTGVVTLLEEVPADALPHA